MKQPLALPCQEMAYGIPIQSLKMSSQPKREKKKKKGKETEIVVCIIFYCCMYSHLFLVMTKQQLNIIHDFSLVTHYSNQQLVNMLSDQHIFQIDALDTIVT